MTDWQRDMARTLVRMFNETFESSREGCEVDKHVARMKMFSIHCAMTHLLDDLAEGRVGERIFYGINVPPPLEEEAVPRQTSERERMEEK